MAGARSEVDGDGGGLTRHSGATRSASPESIVPRCADEWIPGSRFARPGMTRGGYFPAPPRLSRNTPCSPNMFQTHQGRVSGTGRP